MYKFKANFYGGVDVLSTKGKEKFLLHLDEADLDALFEVRQKGADMALVRGRVATWVGNQVASDNLLAEFNCRLLCGDEISEREICERILNDDGLMQKIAEEYREIVDDPATEEGCAEWWYADEAIGTHVSVRDVMGQILCDGNPKELDVGRWRVVVLEKGDSYGLNNMLVYDKAEPAVEFYDLQSGGLGGEFTGAQYGLHSLLTSDWSGLSLADRAEQGIGLSLYLDVPEWTVQPEELDVIACWLGALNVRMLEKPLTEKLEDAKEQAEGMSGAGLQEEEKEGLF